jgi:hypothetical protein
MKNYGLYLLVCLLVAAVVAKPGLEKGGDQSR